MFARATSTRQQGRAPLSPWPVVDGREPSQRGVLTPGPRRAGVPKARLPLTLPMSFQAGAACHRHHSGCLLGTVHLQNGTCPARDCPLWHPGAPLMPTTSRRPGVIPHNHLAWVLPRVASASAPPLPEISEKREPLPWPRAEQPPARSLQPGPVNPLTPSIMSPNKSSLPAFCVQHSSPLTPGTHLHKSEH